MNIVIWLVAGGILGWLGYTYFGFNERRGRIVAIVIGAAGGLLGGKVVAPMFAAANAVPGDFSAIALVFAAGIAAAFLFAGNFVHDRWGV